MEFSKQFIEIMDAVADRLGIIVDWTSQNVVPYLTDVCQRIVNYEVATSVAWMVLMVVLSIISLVVYNWSSKLDDGEVEAFFLVGLVGVLAITLIIIGVQSFDIIEALTIPEKTIYEFMRYTAGIKIGG